MTTPGTIPRPAGETNGGPAAEDGDARFARSVPTSPDASLPAATRAAQTGAELSPIALAGVLLRRSRMIMLSGFALALLVVGAVLLKPRTYTATSVFMPQNKRGAANLTAIAAQFGVSVPTADPGQSPAFYAEFVKLRSVMTEVASRPYRTRTGSSIQLAEAFRVRGLTDSLVLQGVLDRLDDATVADVDLKTGTVRLDVTTRDPLVSQQVNARFLDFINAFNLRSRQTQAAAERRFTERRFDEASVELRQAEERLQAFLQSNRVYSGSPELTFQQERLAREVSLRQQVRSTLAQAVEQAKIDEVRDTPLITVIEQPAAPILPDKRGLVKLAVLAAIGGAMLGALFALFGDALASGVRTGDPHWREVHRALGAVGRMLRFRRGPRGARAGVGP